jgi:hypothetical protein
VNLSVPQPPEYQTGARLKKVPLLLFEDIKNWARLIQKIYEIDPLSCPKFSGALKIISVIDDEDVIKKDPQAPGFMGGKGQAAAL